MPTDPKATDPKASTAPVTPDLTSPAPVDEPVEKRVGADGETVETPAAPTDEVIVATVPGDNPDNFVTLTLANPLNKKDRTYLGLPEDARTEVGQKIRVNKNGAQQIINAGYATVDPEDRAAVRAALTPVKS